MTGKAVADPHAELKAKLKTIRAEIFRLRTRPFVKRLIARSREVQSKLKKASESWEPLQKERDALTDELARRESLTIGPWVVSRRRRWGSGTMYVHGGDRAWYNRRVWLRVVTRDEQTRVDQWEAEIDGVENDGRETLVLGPPGEDAAADFRRYMALVEARCRELGFYVVDGEEEER